MINASPLEIQKQRAARWAGISYLLTFVTVVTVNFAVYAPMFGHGSPSEMVREMLAHQTLFRIGIVADLFYATGFLSLIAALFMILKDVEHRVALFAALLQIVYVTVWVMLTLKFFDALRLGGRVDTMPAFTDEQWYSLSRHFLSARFDRYYGVLIFYSLGSLLFNILWLRSGYIPKMLAWWGILACAWCLFCAGAFLISPGFENYVNLWVFDVPMALFDIVLSIRLLVTGIRFSA